MSVQGASLCCWQLDTKSRSPGKTQACAATHLLSPSGWLRSDKAGRQPPTSTHTLGHAGRGTHHPGDAQQSSYGHLGQYQSASQHCIRAYGSTGTRGCGAHPKSHLSCLFGDTEVRPRAQALARCRHKGQAHGVGTQGRHTGQAHGADTCHGQSQPCLPVRGCCCPRSQTVTLFPAPLARTASAVGWNCSTSTGAPPGPRVSPAPLGMSWPLWGSRHTFTCSHRRGGWSVPGQVSRSQLGAGSAPPGLAAFPGCGP